MRVYFDLANDLVDWYKSQENKRTALNNAIRAGKQGQKDEIMLELAEIKCILQNKMIISADEEPPQSDFSLDGFESMAVIDND